MDNFFRDLPHENAIEIEKLSRLMYELRSSRQQVLDTHGVADEAALLARITTGDLPEHPAYESYLSACALTALLAEVRADLTERTRSANASTNIQGGEQ